MTSSPSTSIHLPNPLERVSNRLLSSSLGSSGSTPLVRWSLGITPLNEISYEGHKAELRSAARALFEAALGRMTDKEVTPFIEEWQHQCESAYAA